MLSAIQIVEFLNQVFLQPLFFLHVDTNSQKLKFDWKVFGGAYGSGIKKSNKVLMLNNWQVANKSCIWKWGAHKRAVHAYLTADAYKRLKTNTSYVNVAYKVLS